MRKFLSILSLLLILAMLLPLAVACSDNPPPENGEGNGEGNGNGNGEGEGGGNGDVTPGDKYVDVKIVDKKVTPIADFTDEATLALQSNQKFVDGTSSTISNGLLSWSYTDSKKTREVSIALPEALSIGVCNYFEFTINNKGTANGTEISVTMMGCKTTNVISLNFTGEKTVRIRCEEFSVVDPFPAITAVVFSIPEGSNGFSVTIASVVATTNVYELTVPEGINANDSAQFDMITKRYREYLVGTPEGSTTQSYLDMAAMYEEQASIVWDSFKSCYPDKLETLFLSDAPADLERRIQAFYQYLQDMAYGYGFKGSSLYHNADLLADIIRGLEYGYENLYGKDLVNGESTVGNWWQWDIGIPLALTNTLTIIEEGLTLEQIKKYLSPFDVLVPHPMGAAANKTWTARCAILAGALEHDPMRLCIAKSFLDEVFVYVDTAGEDMGDGGFYTDGSFVQHGVSPYTGGYGVSLINELTNIMYFLNGTNFLFNGTDVNNQYEWIFDSFRPIMYGDNLFASTRGREVNRETSEREVFNTTVISMIKMQSYAPAEYKDKLVSLIRYFMLSAESDYTDLISPDLMSWCAELYVNDSVALPEPYITAKVLGGMDRIVQHGPRYGVCLSLSSTRMHKYESINGENMTAWYHGDGMIYIYTDGYDYNNDYFWYANPYRMPGVTANTVDRAVKNIHPTIPNADAYAGGVAQSKYAASGFILEYSENETQGTFGGTNGWTIQAKKSYFFFDNEIICVGSDISDKSGTSVQTTVENRIWREDDVFTVGGESVEPTLNVETTLTDRVMHFTNMGGYVILKDYGATVKYVKTYMSGDNNGYKNSASATEKRSFLEIVLDHGEGNTTSGKLDSNKYFYAYLPEATVEETKAYANEADVDLLSISGSHAVIEKTLGIVACNFFTANGSLSLTASGMPDYSAITSLTSVSADKACSVMVTKNADGSYTVSVSDPTQLSASVKLEVAITGITQVVSTNSGIAATVENGIATITASTSGSMGATFSVTIK